MLVEFRVSNFRSFRDEQVLSFVASRDTSLSKNTTAIDGLTLLRAAAIYGPNASGKSNLIAAMDVMRELVLTSTTREVGSGFAVAPFALDKEMKGKPSTFEASFYHNDIRYQYGFTASNVRIHDEWLFAYPKGRARLWYERTLDEKQRTIWKYGPHLKGDKRRIAAKTRDDALFLSVAAQWNHKQLKDTAYNWFRDQLRVISSRDVLRQVTARMILDWEADATRDDLKSPFVELLRKADLGIHALRVEELEVDLQTMRILDDDIPDAMQKKVIAHLQANPPLDIQMIHRDEDTELEMRLPLREESDGTRRFFQLMGPFFQTVSLGFTVFVDELETSMHPLLARELVEYVQNVGDPASQAQLIFATHDTTLLDPELLRRDQIWFTEKDKHGATQLHSLFDYKERRPRKGEALQKGYLAGRYGAIPVLKAFGLK